ncbi:hypothetical protein [Burkholderia sp. IDO3]|uniref:hypothetical protein n=1 Tax=Burkholderia sp. IDO3 TaxID=1705310 RepID=UPI0011783AFC|nr:hypothetical protein [Burkholderia sp. IDO3]
MRDACVRKRAGTIDRAEHAARPGAQQAFDPAEERGLDALLQRLQVDEAHGRWRERLLLLELVLYPRQHPPFDTMEIRAGRAAAARAEHDVLYQFVLERGSIEQVAQKASGIADRVLYRRSGRPMQFRRQGCVRAAESHAECEGLRQRDARAAVAKHAPEVLRIGVAKLLAHDAAARVIAGRGRVFGGVGRAVHGTRRAIRRSGGRRRVGASSIMLDMHHGDVRCWVTRSDEAGPNTMPAPRQGP